MAKQNFWWKQSIQQKPQLAKVSEKILQKIDICAAVKSKTNYFVHYNHIERFKKGKFGN